MTQTYALDTIPTWRFLCLQRLQVDYVPGLDVHALWNRWREKVASGCVRIGP